MSSTPSAHDSAATGFWRQPKSVWAVAFAAVIAFMGIGLVDPILPAISKELDATPGQAMLLFTSYLFVTAIAMFFSSWVSSRVGVKRTLLAGLVLVVVFAALAGASDTVGAVIGFRAGWGLGNALFISTALAAIVASASGGTAGAIMLYEAALGLGIAIGPLLGGLLGGISWRGPFFGTAALMAVGVLLIVALLPATTPAAPKDRIRFSEMFGAFRRAPLMVLAAAAFLYNYAFFSLLAWSPFPIEKAAEAAGVHFGAHELGYVFFGWGLALAITSVLVAPRLTARYGRTHTLRGTWILLAVDMALLALFVGGGAGYYVLGQVSGRAWSLLDCVWMSVISITTVGYGEVFPLDFPAARFYTMALLVLGMGAGVWAMSSVTARNFASSVR